MDTVFSFDVFLSHNSKDKPRVRQLAERLRAEGLQVWFDEWVIKAGDDIYLTIEHGLEAARVLVLCLSSNALESDWVKLERSTVLFRDPTNAGRRFVPLLLDDCKLPDTLRRYAYVDFRLEAETAFEQLLGACRVGKAEAESPAVVIEEYPLLPLDIKLIIQPTTSSDNVVQQPAEPLAVLERQFGTHTDWISSVAVSPDGKWLASGSHDKTVKLWSMVTGDCLATLTGHRDKVNCVSFTTDSNSIISSSDDKTIRIWDCPTGHSKHILTEHSDIVQSVVVLIDGERFLSGAARADCSIKLWDIKTGKCLKTIKANQTIMTAAVNASGTQVIIGGYDGKLSIWNLDTAECLVNLIGHSDVVRSVQITTDQQFAVSGSDDKTIKIWHLATARCVASLEGHQDKVLSVAISLNNHLIASTGFFDLTVQLWDFKSGSCLQRLIEREEIPIPVSVTFSPDGTRLVVGTIAGFISIYRIHKLKASVVAEPTRSYSNAKVVLIGESAVGKTTLAHRLIDDDYVKTDSTHGMNVWRLDLPAAETSDLPATADQPIIEREVLLWDLAGQEDYRLIHQLYLHETALALLLINPQKDDPFSEAGDWLKALATVANQEQRQEVPKLLIATRLDVGGMKLSQQKINRFMQEYGFAGFLETSAKRGDNCSDANNDNKASTLKQLIAQSIPWQQLPWTSTPRLLAELKNVLVVLRDVGDIRLLRFSELAQRLEQALPAEKISEADVRTAVTLLANHGLLRPLKFGDLVLLRPELLNGYAAAVIRAARCHKDEIGCVSEEAIYRTDFDFTGVERLQHRPDEELLLRALVQTLLDYSLCMRECEDGQWLLIFPSQYRRDRNIVQHPEIFVSYTFSGELQTIYTTLVVRLWYSRSFDQKELWQNAAEFTTSTGKTVGVVFEKLGDGMGKISAFFDPSVPDELKVVFIEFVHRHLAKYSRDLQRQRRYVCNCGQAVTDLTMVQKRQTQGKDFITCQSCDERVLFQDHIEKRLASNPVARKVLKMEQTEQRERDNQSEEQGLIGHLCTICADANAIFRPTTFFDNGIDGEIEFKDANSKASGKKIVTTHPTYPNRRELNGLRWLSL